MGSDEITFKIRGRIEIQPRFKIQYPMKNRVQDSKIIYILQFILIYF